jgi:23S rRNA (adenine2503-C2)-methyltransferase
MEALKGLLIPELEALAVEEGARPYAGRQLFGWLYARGAESFGDMTDLPKALRTHLAGRYRVSEGTVVEECVSADGARKMLVGFGDGARVECVIIPEPRRVTLCVSTQSGCARGCAFCATGGSGFRRNLTAGEIIEQAVLARRRAPVTNVVFMGQGEPLDNYDNVRRAALLLTSPKGFALGARHVTVSTVGVVPGILRLAEDRLPVRLTLSLAAPDDALREKLAPIAKRWSLEEVMGAVGTWRGATRRDPTIAYVLLKGVNDSGSHARKLGALAHRVNAKVNLIPYNSARGFERPDPETVTRFHETLMSMGLVALVRRERGADILGACGQLAAQS